MFKSLIDATMAGRSLMIDCTRSMYASKSLPHRYYIKFNNYLQLLICHLRMNSKDVSKLLLHQPFIIDIPEYHLIKMCSLCRKLCIHTNDLYKDARLLALSQDILENRATLMREMGVQRLNAVVISNFEVTMNLEMRMFKMYLKIPKETIVAERFLKIMEKRPFFVRPMTMPSEELTLAQYYMHCLRWYMQWKLRIPSSDKIQSSLIAYQLRYRSLRNVKNLFNILHYEVGLTIKQIIEHKCLTKGSADDLHNIFKYVMFRNIDIKKVLKANPQLHKMKFDNVLRIVNLLNEYDFYEKSLQRLPQFLLLPYCEIQMRLNHFQSIPELQVLKNHSSALYLICNYLKAQTRLSYLRHMNVNFITLRLLSSSDVNFKKFITNGKDGTRGREIGISFEKILGLDRREIIRRIAKHPYWRNVGLLPMHDTFKFLSESFTVEDINDNLQLLLYSRKIISDTLDNFVKKDQLLCDNKNYTPKQMLALCLYEIEREFNFSGEGIWQHEHKKFAEINEQESPSNYANFKDEEFENVYEKSL